MNRNNNFWQKEIILNEKYHNSRYQYVKNYTICYYSSFYSSLRDRICANGGYYRFLSKAGKNENAYHAQTTLISKSWLVYEQYT